MQTTCFASGDRIQRALMRLGLLWLLAAITLFIPIAHFVLVPGFLIAGPVMAWLSYRVTQQREQVSGICPSCDVNVNLKVDAADTLPKWTYCPACNAPLHITRVEP